MTDNPRPLYRVLAEFVEARHNCIATGNDEWRTRHTDRAMALVKDRMPSGSGFDSGTRLSFDRKDGVLVFHTSFHHMDENGSYDGWTEHDVFVSPSLAHEFKLRITGENRNDIKEYIAECFSEALRTPVMRPHIEAIDRALGFAEPPQPSA